MATTAAQATHEYTLSRGHLAGYALGSPCYEDAGEERPFTGTNKEVNDYRRQLDAGEEPGYVWNIMSRKLGGTIETIVKIPAADLRLGDVTKINAKCWWKVVGLEARGKLVITRYEWDPRSTADWAKPGELADPGWEHRATTVLTVARKA